MFRAQGLWWAVSSLSVVSTGQARMWWKQAASITKSIELLVRHWSFHSSCVNWWTSMHFCWYSWWIWMVFIKKGQVCSLWQVLMTKGKKIRVRHGHLGDHFGAIIVVFCFWPRRQCRKKISGCDESRRDSSQNRGAVMSCFVMITTPIHHKTNPKFSFITKPVPSECHLLEDVIFGTFLGGKLDLNICTMIFTWSYVHCFIVHLLCS